MISKTVSYYSAADILNQLTAVDGEDLYTCVPTGLATLDEKLDGGLHPGLITIGAVSALGKTSFVLQLADHIAETGRNVLYFTLEMSCLELTAKAVTRHYYSLYKDLSAAVPFSPRTLLSQSKVKSLSPVQAAILARAYSHFQGNANNLFFCEADKGFSGVTAEDIIDAARRFVRERPEPLPPVVIVDYLQIIKPTDDRMTDKQVIDHAIISLKQLSRELNTPVLLISSLNRMNYLEPVSMASFKQSSMIEYSSDLLFGMEYAGLDQAAAVDMKRDHRLRLFAADICRKKSSNQPLDITLKCLKQRLGENFSFDLVMYPAAGLFFEKAVEKKNRLPERPATRII